MNIRLFKAFPMKINGFIFVFSLLVFASLIKLGLWQLDRATQKDMRLEKMELYQQKEAVGLNEILEIQTLSEPEMNESEKLNDLPVRLTGHFNHVSFLLDNQVYKGRLGYQVLKPFQDEKSNQIVLVNLGWLQGAVDRRFIPKVEEISGTLSFEGKVRVIESSIVLEDENMQVGSWPMRIQSIDLDKISTLLAQPLLPFVVYVNNDESLGYQKEWIPIVMPPDKHRGYAFQWFTLAFAWLVLMLMAAYKAANSNNEQALNQSP